MYASPPELQRDGRRGKGEEVPLRPVRVNASTRTGFTKGRRKVCTYFINGQSGGKLT